MIFKNIILYNGKLLLNKFSITKKDNKINIKSVNIKDNIIQVPVYNKYNGIDYISICLPIEYIIINNYIFSPYLILYSYNIKFNNDIDFFNNLNQQIINEFKLEIIYFDNFIKNSKFNFIIILNQYYSNNLNINKIINDKVELNEFIKMFWFNINIINLYIICTIIKYPKEINKNISKELQILINNLKKFKYSLTNNNLDYKMSLNKYIINNFNIPLKLSELKKNNNYFIIFEKNNKTSEIILAESQNYIKIIQVNIQNITNNIININNKNLIYENYKWYYYHPNINFNKDLIIYQTFINNNFINEIIKNLIGFDDNHIIKYYTIDNKINNLIVLSNIFTELKKYLDDISILKNNNYDSNFFKYITKKYYGDDEKLYEILEILFNNYTYPFKYSQYNIESIFDNILYISFYNYKKILVNNKNMLIKFNDILNPKINNIVPYKIKNLYINFLKIIQSLILNEFDIIIYNQKFYIDYFHKNIIKLLLSNNKCIITDLFKEMISYETYNKFKDIIINNMLLIDISNKLSWKTLPKKLNYINFYYLNNDIIFYQQKLNKNILPDNFDIKIKKIIENPFEMYKYIKKEKDFIKWTHFISDKIINLYYIPISLSTDDFYNIGKLLYLLFNINEQNLNDPSYKDFLEFSNLHCKLILDSSRINLKIKENFQSVKSNINLGFLAKHLTMKNEIMTFNNNLIINYNIYSLNEQLLIINKKYNKYKTKYLQIKTSNIELDVYNSNIIFSETS